ncbi:MAG: hydrogenase maturation nickel metallochaperone HypA [Bacillota bacterium]|nr:hydrogenase maturation nickel metallochaperone HypA [Bacillota bacterium]
MHELPITQSIIRICCQEAEKRNIDKVKAIKLSVGEMAPVIPESIQYYYDIMTKGTRIEGAKLVITIIPIIIKCLDCNNEFNLNFSQYKCNVCSSKNILVTSGTELIIDDLELYM